LEFEPGTATTFTLGQFQKEKRFVLMLQANTKLPVPLPDQGFFLDSDPPKLAESQLVFDSEADSLKKLSVVVINYNGAAFLTQCLTALWTHYGNRVAEIIVLDNASTDNSQEKVRPFPQVGWVAAGENLGYGGGTNLAFKVSSSEYLAVLNPDVVVEPGCLEKMCRTLGDRSKPEPVGIVGCTLLFPYFNPAQARVQHLAGGLKYPLAMTYHLGAGELAQNLLESESVKGHLYTSSQGDSLLDADYVTGALVVLHRAMFEQLGGYDELFSPAYFEEADLCLRARQAGWRVVSCLPARAIHHERGGLGGASFNYFYLYHLNRLRFVFKHFRPEQLKAEFLPAEELRLQSVWDGYTCGSTGPAGTPAENGREFQGLQKAYLSLNHQPLTARSEYYDSSFEASGINGEVPAKELANLKARLDGFLNLAGLESRTDLIQQRARLLDLPGLAGNRAKKRPAAAGIFARLLEKLRLSFHRRFILPTLMDVAAGQERFNVLVARQVTEMSDVLGQLVRNSPQSAPVSLTPWDEQHYREALSALREVIFHKTN
jgi:GT2 family glycosyltransferase